MAIKISKKKLDRRMNGHENFKWMVEVHRGYETGWSDFLNEFARRRQWMWATFGPGAHVAESYGLDPMPTWAWVNDDQKGFRFYMSTDEQLSWFSLKYA